MAYIDCENCYHGEVCTYRRASHDKIVLCEHWQPTADVVEVKHGEWFTLEECANEGAYCSLCHKKVYKLEYANQALKSKYCPNCGAKMDKTKKGTEK